MSRIDSDNFWARVLALPRWARVAFVARCFRRAASLFARTDAATYAEQAASRAQVIEDGLEEQGEHGEFGSDILKIKRQRIRELMALESPERLELSDLSNRVDELAERHRVDSGEQLHSVLTSVLEFAAPALMETYARMDLEVIETASRDQGWDDETPVEASVFSRI